MFSVMRPRRLVTRSRMLGLFGGGADAEPLVEVTRGNDPQTKKQVDRTGTRFDELVALFVRTQASDLRAQDRVVFDLHELEKLDAEWNVNILAPDPNVFVHTATVPNTSGDSTYLDFAHVKRQLPLAQVRPMREVVERSIARTSFTMLLLVVAAAVALVLGSVGMANDGCRMTNERDRI